MLHHLAGWIRTEARMSKGRRRWARWIGRGWARVHYGYSVEPTWLELNQCDIPVANLPPAFHGVRIVQLSDFHCSRQVSTTYLNEAVTLAQDQEPDVVVLTGDFIHRGYKYVDRVADTLSRLTAPLG